MARSQKLSNIPNAPAFSAYANATTSIANGVETKVNFQVEDFDTAGNFASSRFTPTVAGYYQINASVQFSGVSSTSAAAQIWKNGAVYKIGNAVLGSTAAPICHVSGIVFLNGSTDYVEIFAYQSSGSSMNNIASASTTWFDGCLVRPA